MSKEQNSTHSFTEVCSCLTEDGFTYPVCRRCGKVKPSVTEESQEELWSEAFSFCPVRIHENSERWLKANYILTRKPKKV